MPIEIEKKLFKSGRKRGLTGDRLNAYVYSTLREIEQNRERREKK